MREEMVKKVNYDTYINASYIKSGFSECHPTKWWEPYGLIICTQGPQDETIEDFWMMVV